MTPRATYRLQLGSGIDFARAGELAGYLAHLGVSHLYISPPFQARAGSTHGYDVADHGRLSDELGGDAGFGAMRAALVAEGVGLIVDFVPNHMGVGSDNPWWQDVLTWGARSAHARTFDIDWQTFGHPGSHFEGKVLVPTLGDHYGAVLERGELACAFDPARGTFEVRYFEHRFPLSPPTYALLFGASSGNPAFDAVLAELRGLESAGAAALVGARFAERAAELSAELARLAAAEPEVAAAIADVLDAVNGEPGRNRLHEILEAQRYRLAYWRVAAGEINYRRFFNINELAGLRVEDDEVFASVHQKLLDLVGDGLIDGARIDHVDGLFDPAGYLRRLRDESRERGLDPYLVVEKILAEHEHLRDWAIDGTTGYEFLSEVVELMIDPQAESALRALYRRQSGSPLDLDEAFYRAKLDVIDGLLGAELQVLSGALHRIGDRNRWTRDFTRLSLHEALRQVVACFPVYRTYVDPEGGATDDDRRDIAWAITAARRRVPRIDESVFDFVCQAMLCELPDSLEAGYDPLEVRRFALKLQQYTGPVMAKAIEDTAFYRHPLLVALNDVGTDPRRFGVSPAGFHVHAQRRAANHPRSMLATSTHDTKRGEDARARIAALSEIPARWAERVRRWHKLNRTRRVEAGDRLAPSRLEAYALYQALIGCWPAELTEPGAVAARPDLVAEVARRLSAYAIKALREAKESSSWSRPDAEYEDAVARFVDTALDAGGPNVFLDDFAPFAAEVAERGVVNSLTQLVLKLTSPGVPDLYQGTELWDLSLVDPDNRRPVDFARRAAVLDEVAALEPGEAGSLLASWRDGRIKLYVMHRLLAARREHPALFASGDYRPLVLEGEHAGSAIAFERTAGDRSLVVCCARLAGRVGLPPVGRAWAETSIAAPIEGGELLAGGAASPRLADLLATLPVAVVLR